MSIFDKLRSPASAPAPAAPQPMPGVRTFTFAALPLKYQNADGAPIRAIAMIEE